VRLRVGQRSRSRFAVPLLCGVSVVAGLTAWAVSRWLYPLGSINHDEQMYVFSARLLRQGHVSLPKDYTPFRPWGSGVHGGRLVLKYTPVWPAVLSIGTLVGSVRVAQAAVAAAAVALIGVLGREVFGRWREGLVAAVIVLLSPLFISQSGTTLPYVFQFVLDLAVVVLVLGALRRWPNETPAARAVVVRLVLAGAVWGVACFARPYDAVLLAIPIAAVVVVSMRHRLHQLLVTLWWTAAGACAPIAALLAYNAVLMGNPLRTTFLITGASDQLGFGTRGVFPTSTFDFSPQDGRISLERNLLQFPGWVFGGALLVAVALFGLWRHRNKGPDVWLVAGIAVTFAVGYAFFWSPYSIVQLWPGARTMGPFYHLPLLIPVALFGASGVTALGERSRALGALTVCALAAITLATATSHGRIKPSNNSSTALNSDVRCCSWATAARSASRAQRRSWRTPRPSINPSSTPSTAARATSPSSIASPTAPPRACALNTGPEMRSYIQLASSNGLTSNADPPSCSASGSSTPPVHPP
jgi:4-amino-4-deoxy-L-arabinose transferase-like glycosyltransferase